MRLEHIIIIGIVLVLCSLVSAMDPDTLWIKTFGGDNSDCGSSLQQTTDGGFIIAGLTCSFPPYNGAYYLVKADSSGNLEWENNFAGQYMLEYPSVVQTTDGGYLLAGSDGDMPFGYIYAVKTDQTGALEWREQYFTNFSHTYCHEVAATSHDSYLLGGTASAMSCRVMFILEIDDQGTTQCGYMVGESCMGEYLRGYSVQECSDGFVVAGGGNTYMGNGAAVARLDYNRSPVWLTFTGSDDDYFKCVRQVSNGSFVAVGRHQDDPDYDYYMVMFDINGSVLWEQIIDTDSYDKAESFVETYDGGFIIAGTSHYYSDYSEADIYLVKTDFSGNLEWDCHLGGSGHETAYQILEISENVFVIVGSTPTASNGTDVLLLKIDADQEGIGLEESLNDQNYLSILSCSPNPCRGFTEIRYQSGESSPTTISIYDMSGHLVRSLGTTTQPGDFYVSWNGNDDYGQPLPGGIYTVVARSGIQLDSRRIILVK